MSRSKPPSESPEPGAESLRPFACGTGEGLAPAALESGVLHIAKRSVLVLLSPGPDAAAVREALEKRGLQVFAVDNLKDAEAVAFLPRFALVDAEVPGALQLLRRIAAPPQEALALVTLGPGQSETEALRAGAQATLRRPLDPADVQLFFARFERHLELVTRSRELFERNEANAFVSTTARVSAAIAHEIRNPLAAARLNVGMLRDALDPASESAERPPAIPIEEQREMLLEIDAALARIDGILGAVAGLARGERPEVTRVNLREVVEKALASVPNRKGVPVELSGDGDVFGYASVGLLEQVIVNLVSNALDALRDHKNPSVLVRVYATVSEARISVRDNGPGVPPEHRERIFEPFFSTKGEAGGTGLGLAISRQAVASMGGALTLASDSGPGACFRIRLRRA